MPRPPISVRFARPTDLDDAAATLAEAFGDDPWFRWLYPAAAHWPATAAEWFTLVLERASSHGQIYVAPGATCSWIPPGVDFPGADDAALAVELLGRQIGDRAAAAFGVIGAAGAVFPHDRPRFHCVYVGVRVAAQRCGVGTALLRRVLDGCDRDGLCASLTSTNDRNLSWYRSLGFVEIGAVPIPGTADVLRPMWREPR